MTPKLRLSFIIGLVFVLASAGHASSPRSQATPPAQTSPDAEQAQPVFRAGINFVRVDVIVTDRDGNPVTDLSVEDFEVVEDGESQTVETFELFEFTGVPSPDAEPLRPIRSAFDEEREATRPDVRLFAIFLDDYHVREGASLRVHEPLIQFIREQLAPSDLLAVMYPLTPLSGVRMTRDHNAIAAEVQRFRGRKYDYEPRNQFEMRYAHYPAMTIEQIRNEVSLTALKALVTHLGGLREGRKSLILVSEGYSNMLPPQLRDRSASGLSNPLMRNPIFDGVNPRESSYRMMSDMNIQSDLQRIFEVASRANTSIYALDPRGLASFEFDIDDGVGFTVDRDMLQSTMDTLRVLADETDGRAIVNNNDLGEGLRQMLKDSSAYYLLGYNSTQAPTDGRFHEIRVRVRRPRVQVRARKGYWALSPDDVTRLETLSPEPEAPSKVDLALSLLTVRRNAQLIQTWLGMTKAEDGRTQVRFVWRPAPSISGRRRADPVRVSVLATNGRDSTYFRGRVPDLALASAAPLTGRDGASGARVEPAQVVFDAEPGPIQLTLSVEDGRGRVLDNDIQHFVIPDFTRVDVAISSPVVLRAQNAFAMRQLRVNPQAVPETGREFRRTDQLLIRFEVYAPGATPPTITARLLNRGGQAMADLPFTAPAQTGEPYVIQLPLAGLAPGEYLVEIEASAGAEPTQQLIAMRVTS